MLYISLCLIFYNTTREELVELFCKWESWGPQNLDNLSMFMSLQSRLRKAGFEWTPAVCLKGYSPTASSPPWLHPIAYNYGTLAFLFFMFLPHFNILELLVARQYLKSNSHWKTHTLKNENKIKPPHCSDHSVPLANCVAVSLELPCAQMTLSLQDVFCSRTFCHTGILVLHLACCFLLTAIPFYFKSLNFFFAQSSVQQTS